MMRPLPRWPIAIASTVFLALTIVLVQSVIQANGQLTYSLDDPYIHLSVARNLFGHGVWGITPLAGASASSSPAWTILNGLTGTSLWGPLVLNIGAGLLVLTIAGWVCAQHQLQTRATLVLLVVLVFFVPLPALVLTGMEHLLQLALCMLFLGLWGQLWNKDQGPHFAWLGLISFLLVSTRFEGLFLAGLGAVMLLFKGPGGPGVNRDIRSGLSILVGVVAPLLLHGTIAMWSGGFYLPNSIMLKTKAGTGLAMFDVTRLLGHLGEAYYLTLLLIILAGTLLLEYRARKFTPAVACGFLVLATAVAHLQFADVGWFFRYDAYLIGLAALYCIILLTESGGWFSRLDELGLGRFAVVLVAATVVVVPLGARSSASLQMTVPATTHIHLQQVQMGRFVGQFYDGKVVAANDVGAISYFGSASILDLWGLASNQVAEARLAEQYGPEQMAAIARDNNVSIAIVYEEAFEWFGGLPPEWEAMGRWSITNRQPLSMNVVTFFAVDPRERDRLAESLESFELPREVNFERR
ncbi:MAG: hypothetical protein HN348_20820 [Proteobacteria bacterium]|jgi:hypothetical protein|nr:hypothetical protein [Pseudomonadota bacterium]